MKSLMQALDRFVFGFSAPAAVAAFRIMFGVTLLWNASLRMMHTEFYFTDLGGVSSEAAGTLLPEFFRGVVRWAPSTLEGAWGMQIALVISLLVLILGPFGRWGSRITALVALFCHLGILQRNYSIVYGADIVTSFWIFGLCFVDSTERFSIRSWRNSRKADLLPEPEWSRILTSMGARMMQIQLCLIYGYTGFEKLKGNDWWDQTAIWKVLGNEQLMLADLSFLRNVPLVIGLATWGTVLFEIYAPVLLWPRATRKWTIAAGWALHIGISLTMGLYIFSLTMMSAYLLFFDSTWLEHHVARVIKGKGHRGVVPSARLSY